MKGGPVSSIIDLAARVLSLDADTERSEIFEQINGIREMMFNGALGPKIREAFFIRRDCVETQPFFFDCNGRRCQDTYIGISLPHDVLKCDVLSIDGQRVDVRAEHQPEPSYRSQCHGGECYEALSMGGGYTLPVDFDRAANLGFRLRNDASCPVDKKDEQMLIGIDYIDANGDSQREDIELSSEQLAFATWSVQALRGISLPRRESEIEIWNDTDSRIDSIHPSIGTLDYKRILIRGAQAGRPVYLESALFAPKRVVFETDLIETTDLTFWQAAFQWRDLFFKTKRTAAEQRSMLDTNSVLLQIAEATYDVRETENEQIEIPVHRPGEGIAQRMAGIYHMPRTSFTHNRRPRW